MWQYSQQGSLLDVFLKWVYGDVGIMLKGCRELNKTTLGQPLRVVLSGLICFALCGSFASIQTVKTKVFFKVLRLRKIVEDERI
ncbi:hypothetical protein Hdeb2414_s0675g00933811 [Helianthus debilis subsp. tardiflorus]